MAWIQLIIDFIAICLVNGVFFYSINRKLKKMEVEEKKVDVLKKQDDEWQELYLEQKSRVTPLQDKVDKLTQEKTDLSKAIGLKEIELTRLKGEFNQYKEHVHWYKCTVNNCPNRRPPHVFDMNGVELGAMKETGGEGL